jgi:hypothetical protein
MRMLQSRKDRQLRNMLGILCMSVVSPEISPLLQDHDKTLHTCVQTQQAMDAYARSKGSSQTTNEGCAWAAAKSA